LIEKDETVSLLMSKALNNYLDTIQKQHSFIHLNAAKERYDIFCAQFPEILKYCSLGDIASFLGITQQSLSRIRKEK